LNRFCTWFGAEYDVFRAHTSRLIPGVYEELAIAPASLVARKHTSGVIAFGRVIATALLSMLTPGQWAPPALFSTMILSTVSPIGIQGLARLQNGRRASDSLQAQSLGTL
jgi:hypothetical protein